jgi:hypothetical protein
LRTAESKAENGASAESEERANLQRLLEERENKMKTAAAELEEARLQKEIMEKKLAVEKF